MYNTNVCELTELKGKILKSINVSNDDSEIIFTINNNEKYKMGHKQDCCEEVYINDICGDLEDLLGVPILQAEEVYYLFDEDPHDIQNHKHTNDSYTWTFYKFATIKGSVTIRWYGESNGCYSEDVDFGKMYLS